jgi:hypothetical protein
LLTDVIGKIGFTVLTQATKPEISVGISNMSPTSPAIKMLQRKFGAIMDIFIPCLLSVLLLRLNISRASILDPDSRDGEKYDPPQK